MSDTSPFPAAMALTGPMRPRGSHAAPGGVIRGETARAVGGGQNKGGGAAAAALHLIALSRKWAGQTKGIGFRA